MKGGQIYDVGLGDYTVNKGKDDRGEYISYYDKWDINPFGQGKNAPDVSLGIGKPFDLYDRIYYKDYGDGNKKKMYYSNDELSNLDSDSKNFNTKKLQRELNNRGYKLSKSIKANEDFDGVYGNETKKALEDWQNKNKSIDKKAMGGDIPQAQLGEIVPASFPLGDLAIKAAGKIANLFSSDKTKPTRRLSSSSEDDNETKLLQQLINIKDPRKIRKTTGQPINPNVDLVSGEYDSYLIKEALQDAKNYGLSKEDAWNLAAIDFQETGWGKTDHNMGHVLRDEGGDTESSKNTTSQEAEPMI
jgi:hypothetical protein